MIFEISLFRKILHSSEFDIKMSMTKTTSNSIFETSILSISKELITSFIEIADISDIASKV